ncbi:hypothetical protein CTEN210_15403 [Chaetoceros tenuissimus]|uniref:CDP-alcohol phosphatidyltransferase n=1 Tax=Chaetoceros tenuissimus TaxID=426638 RepID=A0AAD3D7L9_9STRA|nr:hypothetical protein CTEN210_15403 [Chaetoceros tenuissimus]
MCAPSSKTGVDGTLMHTWLHEAPTSNNNTGALTDDGLENIAAHKYKAGHYTFFDNYFNPHWTKLTELLPMSLAPNMVTCMGGFHCLLAYLILWYHAPQYDNAVPDWVIFFCGYCNIAYYTFDCMDGKQARRTGASSPLGQLFDHGFDCICNLAHISTIAGYLMIGRTGWFMALQASVFFTFFMAQWEEYYTGELPHAVGNFGVTELNYGLGILAILNGILDREIFWRREMVNILPSAVIDLFPQDVATMKLKYFCLSIWFALIVFMIIDSAVRVALNEKVKKNGLIFSALTRLLSPAMVLLAPFILPEHIMENETRYISICTGLLCSFLTKKMIVFSMAKMTYAVIQKEALVYFATFLWIRYDTNITEEGATLLIAILCVWYSSRMTLWASKAVNQICERLDIYCFTIKEKVLDDPDAYKKVQ